MTAGTKIDMTEDHAVVHSGGGLSRRGFTAVVGTATVATGLTGGVSAALPAPPAAAAGRGADYDRCLAVARALPPPTRARRLAQRRRSATFSTASSAQLHHCLQTGQHFDEQRAFAPLLQAAA
jgi:hypothetical protein